MDIVVPIDLNAPGCEQFCAVLYRMEVARLHFKPTILELQTRGEK